jgi:transcription initiation factor TFIID subunit 5
LAKSAGDDYAINLWDLGSSRLIKTMAGHTSRIHSLSFSAESSILVSGSSDCTMRAWDVASSQQTALSVNGVPQSASANEGALVGMKDSRQRVGEDESPDLLLTLPTKRTPVFTTKFTPRNLCLAAGPIF